MFMRMVLEGCGGLDLSKQMLLLAHISPSSVTSSCDLPSSLPPMQDGKVGLKQLKQVQLVMQAELNKEPLNEDRLEVHTSVVS